ncbi:uncharacterized protein DUF3899 [Staphylococcus hominis]
MKNFKTWLIWLFIPLLIAFIVWVAFTQRSFISFLDILFYISLILFICLFLILLVQEGIFDATSFGFRRMRYQLSSHSKKKTLKDDEFFNPKQVKKDNYIISAWILPALILCAFYFILIILISLLL